ncbi:hypothetical protein [Streptomyces sp. NPDC050264]|uniref:hypothetical protein n=1 Tax=Streptomyces sp. NPDC050264 TaxID=3155038 RepID=UPI00343368D1
MAFFGNGNADLLRQIICQLGKVGEDLAALKQQVSDQQLAIDQTRHEANAEIARGLTENRAAVNTGLIEDRAVIREGLASINDRFSDPLIHIGSELGVIRAGVAQLDDQLKACPDNVTSTGAVGPEGESVPPEAEPRAGSVEQGDAHAPEPDPKPEQPWAVEPDPGILRAAAGIAHATVEAHRDTWAFLIQVAANAQHFHIPGKVKDDDGFVSVRLSGPSLVAALTSLAHVTHATDNTVTRAIASHIQGKITAAVQAIIDRPSSDGSGSPNRIVIDDQAEDDDADRGGSEGNDQPDNE